jgi:hypothetical protein
MYRVLRPGGRVVALVWRDISHSPGFAVLANALEANVGEEAGTVMRAPFVFGDDPETLASLLQDAGFADVAVQAVPGKVKFDSIQGSSGISVPVHHWPPTSTGTTRHSWPALPML